MSCNLIKLVSVGYCCSSLLACSTTKISSEIVPGVEISRVVLERKEIESNCPCQTVS